MAISDISVSRWHAIILYQNEKFILIDNNSKYGTLVKLEEPIEIQNEKLEFQSGRTLITLTTTTFEEVDTSDSEFLAEVVKGEKRAGKKTKKSSKKATKPSKNEKSSVDKQVAARVKMPSKRKSTNVEAENDSPSDVEEITPHEFPEINKRSKKIGKNSKKDAPLNRELS